MAAKHRKIIGSWAEEPKRRISGGANDFTILPNDFLLGLDDADGLAVDEEDVVGRTGIGGVFPDGLSLAGVEGDTVLGLDGPTRGAELRVDGVAGDLFGSLVEAGGADHVVDRHSGRAELREPAGKCCDGKNRWQGSRF